MTAKEYLSQAWTIDNEIQSMLEEVAVLRSMAEKTTAVITGMPSNATRNTSQLSDTIAKIIEREEKIDAEIDRLVDLRSEIYETNTAGGGQRVTACPVSPLYEIPFVGGDCDGDEARTATNLSPSRHRTEKYFSDVTKCH